MIRMMTVALGTALAIASPAKAVEWQPLLAPTALAELAETTEVRILDIRVPQADGPSFATGHVPGAVNAPYASWRGPAENPGQLLDDAALTERVRSAGIDFETPVVIVYQGETQSDFGAAARVYWTLKSAGIEQLAILNGGFKAWQEAGLPVSDTPAAVTPTDITVTLSDAWLATAEDVAAASEGNGAVLVDARPEAFFRGETQHPAAQGPGTIARAVNFVHSRWFAPEETVVTAPEAAIARARELAAEADGREIISFCNTGHWAATNWFALSEIAGIDNVRMYPESVVGWTLLGRPLFTGN